MPHAPAPDRLRRALLAAPLLLPAARSFAAEAAPPSIRIGSPDMGIGGKPFPGANPLAIAQARGWLEEAFAASGTKIEWHFFRGAGPAVNEALAAEQLDVVYLGDLASVIGRARGLPTRFIAISGRGSNSYLAAAPGVKIASIADLKGRKVALLKGTAYQRPFDALLASAGLTEKDVKAINMDWPTAKAAVVAGNVDATFGGADLLLLKDKGVTVPLSTRGRGPAYAIHAGLLATQKFIDSYPTATVRLLRSFVRAARWASDEANREALLALFAERSGQPIEMYRSDLEGDDLRLRNSPLFDEAALTVYRSVVDDARQLGLIRASVDVDAWIAPAPLQAALAAEKLDGYWPRQDRTGKPQA